MMMRKKLDRGGKRGAQGANSLFFPHTWTVPLPTSSLSTSSSGWVGVGVVVVLEVIDDVVV